MKAVVKYAREKSALAIREIPEPVLKPQEVLIRVKCAAVCGSDLHAYNYDPGYEFIRVPVILGHEFSGVIAEIGEAVKGFKAGDRVLAEATQYCGRCFNCLSGRTNICENFLVTGLHLDGGMAEYACIDARYIHKLPEKIDFTIGALVEPLSVAIHGVADNCRIAPGDTVLVMGAGVIGLLAAQAARTLGAGRVIVAGVAADAVARLPWAKEKGFTTICLSGQPLEGEFERLAGSARVDVVLECSGSPEALLSSLHVLRKGGQLTILGLYARPTEIFFTTAVRNEITFRTSYSSLWINYEQAIKLIEAGKIEVATLAESYPLTSAEDAFKASLRKEIVKAVLVP